MRRIVNEDGSYTIHKAQVPGSSATFSAWYDTEGRLQDVERTSSPFGRVGTKQRAFLARMWGGMKTD